MATDILKDYALAIRRKLRANPATPETGLAPDFQRLLERLLAILPVVPDLVVSPEYLKGGVGRPDIALIKQGEPPRAFIDAQRKEIDEMKTLIADLEKQGQ